MDSQRRLARWRAFLGVCLLLAAWGAPCFPSEDSKLFVLNGRRLRTEGKLDDALKSFARALVLDAQDQAAMAWYGVTRLDLAKSRDDYEVARRYLVLARSKGASPEFVDLPLAHVHLALGNHEKCAAYLRSYEKHKPGDWQCAYTQGLLEASLGHDSAAASSFHEALALGASSPEACYYWIGACQAKLGQSSDAADSFRCVANVAPHSTYAAKVCPLLHKLDALAHRGCEESKPWFIRTTLFGGYDSNVIALGDDTLVFGGVEGKKDAWFLGASVEAGYRLDLTDRLQARVQGGGRTINYDGISTSDTDSGYLAAGADVSLCDCFSLGLDGQVTHYWVNGKDYSNVWSVSPSGTVRWQEWTSTTFAYAFRENIVVREPSLDFVDADAETHTASLSQYVKVPCTRLVVTPYLQYAWAASDGSEFRHEAFSAGITLRHPVVCGIEAIVGFDYTRAWYEERSIFSGDFSEDRDDVVYGASARIERRFGSHAMVFLEGSWDSHDSEVTFYDYQRNIYTFGVELGF